jgi:PAS domain S-box-containing protein
MISEQEIHNASILIVDDQRSIVLLLEKMLHIAGYTCVSSTMDPQTVCELYRQNRYDLILLDLQMPGMDGFQIMENLKEIETDDYLPVLVITAQPEHKLKALAAGARDFIIKPFDLDEVPMRIYNMLEVRLLYKKLGHTNQVLEQMVQKRAAELREAKTQLNRNQTLMQNSMDGIHVMDMQGNLVEANDAFCHMLGYTPEEMSRLNVSDWDVQWSTSELKERFKDHIVNRARFETIHRRKDGGLINVEISTSSMQVEEEYLIFASSHDITERKKAEAERLLKSETERKKAVETHAHLIAHLEASPDFVGFADATDAYVIYLNRAGRAMIGIGDNEDVTKLRIPDAHPAWAKHIIEEVALPTAVSTGLWQGECAFLHRDGHEIPVSMVLIAHKSPSGSVEVFSTISRDITERKNVEAKLSESYGKLRQHALHLDNVREEERVRIAREIHDEMGATLTALKMSVHWLSSKLPAEMKQLADETGSMDKLVTAMIHTMRHVVSQLMPTQLHDMGFATAVEHYVRDFQKRTGIECGLALPETQVSLEENLSSTLFRILQESLNNIAKHAQATSVGILLIIRDHSFIMVIKDNGIGFDRNMNKENTFGLFGIRSAPR